MDLQQGTSELESVDDVALADRMKLSNVRFLGQQPYKIMPKFSPLADVFLVHLNDHKFLATFCPMFSIISQGTLSDLTTFSRYF